MEKAGYVYVLKNPYMPGVVKIGKTAMDPAQRAVELARPTGVPGAFEVHHSVFVADRTSVESAVHARLADRRVDGTEFFAVASEEAVRTLDAAAAAPVVVEKTKKAGFSRMTIDLPSEVHACLKIACAQDGITLVDAVRALVAEYLRGRENRGPAHA